MSDAREEMNKLLALREAIVRVRDENNMSNREMFVMIVSIIESFTIKPTFDDVTKDAKKYRKAIEQFFVACEKLERFFHDGR